MEAPSGHQATVRVQHQQAAEHKAEEEGVVENVADDVAKSDKNAAESRPEEGALLQKRGAGEEQDGDGAQHTWGWWL